ncbi:MAG: HyaD/HybD family hydrogenase maturation endopeptidase [Candidatus Zixiibacteriota bacterium]|nr:MAG: HyaD/HybD family hydrogenase maturation endopeptidase [candidate division Zixibacteria bacterium]
MLDREKTDRPKTAILGAGNILMGDDGVGVHVVNAMKEQGGLPDGVELIDAGTATLDVLGMLEGVEHLIIIDAVKSGAAPGTIYRFSPDEVSETSSRKVSLHQISLLETLNASKMLGVNPPRVTIVGIEPKTIAVGNCLSKEVANRIPKIIDTIRSLLEEPIAVG